MRISWAVLCAAAAVLVSVSARSQEITIRLGNAASPPHPFYKAGEMWKDEVEKRSGGRVKVQYLHSRALGEDRQLIEGVMGGTIDATICSTISMTVQAGKPEFEALQLPFMISSYENLAKVLTSDAAQRMLDGLATAGLKGLSLFEGGQRHYLSAKGPVRTVEDFTGLKTRVMNMPMHLAIWRRAGAAPVGMNYGEIYTSLQTKVIDAVEINLSSLESERFWEPAKHFTYTGHYFWTGMLIYNKAKFDRLPQDIQKIMVEAGRDIIVPQIMATKQAEAEQAEALKKAGVQFYQFSEMDKMRELMRPIIEERVSKDKNIAAFVDTVKKIEAGN
jgi:tripartite ATP-independent transporter DctP family solute receptor